MTPPFLYDTHYQLNTPLALLDLTLSTASPTQHSTDDSLARMLARRVNDSERHVIDEGVARPWKANRDMMVYWLGYCHDAGLLSRQNSYDYWLMNFHWINVFEKQAAAWGHVESSRSSLAKTLLFNWAWRYDAPMLVALAWKMYSLGTTQPKVLVEEGSRNIEEALIDAFAAVRDASSDARARTKYRHKIEELSRPGLEVRTRRHKLYTHRSLLIESGMIGPPGASAILCPGLSSVMAQFASGRAAVAESLRPGPLGPGTELYLDIAQRTLAQTPVSVVDLDEDSWGKVCTALAPLWKQILKWDRKFLNIRALADLFVARHLSEGKPVLSTNSWLTFLTQKARQSPEELTVHVDRLGRVEFLRLA